MMGDVKETVARGRKVAFNMQLEALEFMAGQEASRGRKEQKHAGQRARKVTGPPDSSWDSQSG